MYSMQYKYKYDQDTPNFNQWSNSNYLSLETCFKPTKHQDQRPQRNRRHSRGIGGIPPSQPFSSMHCIELNLVVNANFMWPLAWRSVKYIVNTKTSLN